MIKNNYFSENSDLMLHFNQFLNKEEMVAEYEGDFEDHKKYEADGDEKLAYAPSSVEEAYEGYSAILEGFGDISGNITSQYAQDMDAEGLKLENGKVIFPAKMVEVWNKFKEAGLLPISLRRESNGLGIPVAILTLASEVMARADLSFAMSIGLLQVMETIERFGSQAQKDKWLPLMSTGEYAGAMSLTEPDFGSDLSSVKTKAEKQPDGSYKLSGVKRFISHGCGMADSPAVLLTLARTGNPESGARGLSFFIVDGKDVEIASIEHKMGIRCSPTCEVVYENVTGDLLGEEGAGLTKYSMAMMNGARLGTGTSSVGVGTAAYYEAVKYASERVQFGKTIQDIPAVKAILNRMERELAAMRCLNMEAAYAMDLYHWRSHRLEAQGVSERDARKDPQVKLNKGLATLLTPLTKMYCSEKANELAYDSVQVHGGAGFIEEYDCARIFRDVRILSIYEGTTQLQVVAAIGGVVSGMSEKGNLREMLTGIESSISVSEDAQDVRKLLEEGVNAYKSIEDTEQKAMAAQDLVEIASRTICGYLLEKTTAQLDGAQAEHRRGLADAYNTDSLAQATGNLLRLQRTARKPATV